MQTRRAFIQAMAAGAAGLWAGCKSGGGGSLVSPSAMTGVVTGHMNSIYNCWVSAKIPNAAPNRKKITIQFVTATSSYRGIPIFNYEGQNVGGLYYGRCGGTGVIKLAAFDGTRYNDAVLRHELCHHMDMQGPCIGGHPTLFKKNGCCPFWPYLSSATTVPYSLPGSWQASIGSLDDGQSLDLHATSIFRRFEDDTVGDVLLFNTDLSVAARVAPDDLWWAGLKSFTGAP